MKADSQLTKETHEKYTATAHNSNRPRSSCSACGDEGDYQIPETTPHLDILHVSGNTIINNPLVADVRMYPLAEKILDSTVYILAVTSEGQIQGSGFAAENGIVATAYHVLGSGTPLEKIWIQPMFYKTYFRADSILAFDIDNDIAIFRVEELTIPPLPLANSDEVSIGEQIVVVGAPQGLKGTFSEGNVSAVRENVSADHDARVIQITAPTSANSSGSPVCNLQGEVIGINAFDVEGENLNFAVPSNALRDLIGTVTIE